MIVDDELNFSIRPTEGDDTGTGSLRLCLRGRADIESIDSDRLARAVEWALDLDSQYRDLIRAGAQSSGGYSRNSSSSYRAGSE